MTGHPRTIPAVLDRIADQFSDHNALVTDDRRLTFAELRDEVRRAAAAMVELGVNAGDRVAIWSPNTWHWVVACLATTYAGGVLVPLNTRYTAGEASDILARTGAPLLFASGEFLGADKAASIDRDTVPERRHMGRVHRTWRETRGSRRGRRACRGGQTR
jgi:acyl-CoA synthetase (AMP-forming)/AMP-acid ligase II